MGPWSGAHLLLPVCLLLLLCAVWLEPPGSNLTEPDETRYAEISREMVSSGDLVTPRLDGVAYFEKPPLLYWMNAASIRVFGQTAWAARLPARLASLGIVLLLLFGTGGLWGPESPLLAAIFYLASPLGFILSRLNLTDGLLTFFFAATLLAARATIRRQEQRRPTRILSAMTGIAAAGAVLAKGAVGVLLPGLIVVVWCAATGRIRHLKPLVLGPGPAVFLLLCAPWFLVMERRHPGFLRFYFLREHLMRFTTTVHHHEGPFYYFIVIFLCGFLSGLPFLASTGRRLARVWRQSREWSEELFFLTWLAVVVGFFSFSGSKLPPYVLPAFPAAAALAARAFADGGGRSLAPWRFHALLVSAVLVSAAIHPAVRSEVMRSEITPLAGAAALALGAGAWGAYFLARRARPGAFVSLAAGWFVFYAGIVWAWQSVPSASEVHDLADIAKDVAQEESAKVVFYRTMLYGVLWDLRTPVPVGEYRGELRPESSRLRSAQPEIFWPDQRFWKEWNSPRRVLAIVRGRNLQSFAPHGRAVEILARGRDHFLVANFLAGPQRISSLFTSANLYRAEIGDRVVPLDQIPLRALERVQRESGGERLVWAILERRQGMIAYEVMTGGHWPRAFEVSPNGDLVYVEEELAPGKLPPTVVAGISRVRPGVEIAYATHEYRRASGPRELYEVYLPRGPEIHEIHFQTSGEVYGAEERAF